MIHPSSFRDKSGFIFTENGEIYRAIAFSYKESYEHLINSGLYDKLVDEGLLIPHTEVNNTSFSDIDISIFKILKPIKVDFISYPYEWCFSQLKDAALATLKIQKIALEFGMTLKDASAFNIQFYKGRPILIDTLSFEKYILNSTWQAYRQFCEHFLSPLSLMSFNDARLNCLSERYIDGIPLELAAKILPFKSRLKTGISLHIFFHGLLKKKYSFKDGKEIKNKKISERSLKGLVYSLESTVKSLKSKKVETIWSDYYSEIDKEYSESKKQIVDKYINIAKPSRILDIGSNTGRYSVSESTDNSFVILADSENDCTERLYLYQKNKNIQNIIPIVCDISNPSPSIGWRNIERDSLIERLHPDLILSLAIVHHLTISYNLNYKMIADFYQSLAEWLIIEYIPEDDKNFVLLIQNRSIDITDYSKQNFEKWFSGFFTIQNMEKINNSNRILYLMKRK